MSCVQTMSNFSFAHLRRFLVILVDVYAGTFSFVSFSF